MARTASKRKASDAPTAPGANPASPSKKQMSETPTNWADPGGDQRTTKLPSDGRRLPSLSAIFGSMPSFEEPVPGPSTSPTQPTWAPSGLPATSASSPSTAVRSGTSHGSTSTGSSVSTQSTGSPFMATSWSGQGSAARTSWTQDGSGSSYRGSGDEVGPSARMGPPRAPASRAQTSTTLLVPTQRSPTITRGGHAAQPAEPQPFVRPPPGVPPHLHFMRRAADLGLGFGDFDVLDTLGTGTFGRVLLVRSIRDGRFYAMKVLVKEKVVELSQVEHINSERAILANLRHPGIVNLICTLRDERNLYIMLEFVQGGELFSHLRRAGRFTADVARFYAANIILALEHMHSKDIVYRDLKPENLLLDHMARRIRISISRTQGYVKLTDLGFSKYVPDRTFTLCGTPSFLSPEIIIGSGHGKPADWWAFGVLLFEMLCGYPPFYDEEPIKIYEQIMAGLVSFPGHVDPLARDLIRKLLTADLSRRLGNMHGGVQDIKRHPWFEGVPWGAVARRECPAPIVPRTISPGDTVHFDRHAPTDLSVMPGFARARAERDGFRSDVPQPAQDDYGRLFESF